MKNQIKGRFLPLLLGCMLLTACNSGSSAEKQSSADAGASSAQTSESSRDSSSQAESTDTQQKKSFSPVVMPILSLETVKQGSDATDFITKPVSPHVSAQIATWTPNYQMPPAPYYEACHITLTDKDEKVLLKDAAADVKVRGNWTTNYEKKPLRIKFEEKHNLLGLNDGAEMKNWVLLAEYKDASLQRNKTALQMARELLEPDGLYAADAAYVELMVNGSYYGVYLLTEYQQINPNRVNIYEAEKDETSTKIGYLLEFDGNYYTEESLQQFHVNYADNAPLKPYDGKGGSGRLMRCLPENSSDPKKDIGFTIKSKINTQEQHDFIANYMNNVYNILYAAAYEHKAYAFNDDFTAISEQKTMTPQQAVEAVVDVQSLADAYLVAELTCDADIYWSSFFMDVDFSETGSKKLRFEAPWDFDSGLGNKDRCADGAGFYAANIVPEVNGYAYETINPWLAVLMYEDWFQEIIRKKWAGAYSSGVFQRAIDSIGSDENAYAAAFNRNEERWGLSVRKPDIRKELSPQAAASTSQVESSGILANWLKSRVQFLKEQWGN